MSSHDYIGGKTIAVQVTDRLREDIINGKFPPGTHITTNEIADRYGVSHMPVREAFQRLKGEHLIEFIPYKGVKVLSLDKEYICEVFNLTRVIENLLVEEAAERLSKREIAALEKINQSSDDYLLMDTDFHNAIYATSPKRKTVELCQNYRQILVSARGRYQPTQKFQALGRAQHAQIIEAIRAHDTRLAHMISNEHGIASRDDFFDALEAVR